jgi:hypothetical protein
MPDTTSQAYSTEELEYRFQELRAQRLRAKLLFHCYADGESVDDLDDAYGDYYAEDDAIDPYVGSDLRT